MSGAVRIPPIVPPPPAAPSPPSHRTHGRVGLLLVVLGLAAFVAHVLVAGGGSHAYDRNPVPPGVVAFTAGSPYLVSTGEGPGAAGDGAPLTCTYRAPDASPPGAALAVSPVTVDSHATHAIGSFIAPVGGPLVITCTGGPVGRQAVFIDNADSAAVDVSGVLVGLATLGLLVGAGLGLGALFVRGRRDDDAAADHLPDPDPA